MPAMTYAAFKAHVTTLLWSSNDTAYSSSFDMLHNMARSRLNRDLGKLRIPEMSVTATAEATSTTVTLPADYMRMQDLELETAGPLVQHTAHELNRLRKAYTDETVRCEYALEGNTVRLIGPMTEAEPLDLTMTYWGTVPDFATDDVSWLTNNYFDLYVLCVLAQSALLLRDDPRLKQWEDLYGKLLVGVEEHAVSANWGDGPLKARLPGHVA